MSFGLVFFCKHMCFLIIYTYIYIYTDIKNVFFFSEQSFAEERTIQSFSACLGQGPFNHLSEKYTFDNFDL